MGGSKPPTSKAQKRRAKTLTKLDPNRAKRFKLKNKRVQKECEMWESKNNSENSDNMSVETGSNNIVSSQVHPKAAVIKLVNIDIPIGKKGETKRQRKARLREYVFGD